jgi:hypothetical protein
MSRDELCSFCYVERVSMMQRTPFSIFDQRYKRRLEYIQEKCGLSGSTDIPPSPYPPKPATPEPFCLTDKIIETTKSETCDIIAEEHKLSSAALYINNQPAIGDCNNIPAGVKLCLPPSCSETYVLQPEDSGRSIEEKHYDPSRGIPFGSLLRTYNPWISPDYSNLRNGSAIYGCVLCLGPPNGFHTRSAPLNGNPALSTSRLGQTWTYESPPEACEVAKGTTQQCGKWHKAQEGDSCAQLAISNKITSKLLLAANPSLGNSACECEDNITVDKAYCVRPKFG